MSLNVICFSLPYVYPFIHFLTAEQDVDCRLLPTGKDISADFHLKASGKGVKMVYLNLKIGNDSYHPLEKVDKFLPERWVGQSQSRNICFLCPKIMMFYHWDC